MKTVEQRAKEIFNAMKVKAHCTCGNPEDTGSSDHAPDCQWELVTTEAWNLAMSQAIEEVHGEKA